MVCFATRGFYTYKLVSISQSTALLLILCHRTQFFFTETRNCILVFLINMLVMCSVCVNICQTVMALFVIPRPSHPVIIHPLYSILSSYTLQNKWQVLNLFCPPPPPPPPQSSYPPYIQFHYLIHLQNKGQFLNLLCPSPPLPQSSYTPYIQYYHILYI